MELSDRPDIADYASASEVALDLFSAEPDSPVAVFDRLSPFFQNFSTEDAAYLAYLYEVFVSLRKLLEICEFPDAWSSCDDSESFASHFFSSLNGFLQFQVDFLDNGEVCCAMLEYSSGDGDHLGLYERGAFRILPSKSHGDVLILERDRDDLTDERIILDTAGRLIGAESEIMLGDDHYVRYQYFFPRDPEWPPVPLVQAVYFDVESDEPYGAGLFAHGTWMRRDHRTLPDSVGFVKADRRSGRIDPDLMDDYRRQLIEYAPYYHVLTFEDDPLA